jgi:hypothetical protein
VEVLFPVLAPALATWVRESVLSTLLADNVKARDMRADGTYVRRVPAEGEAPSRCQSRFMEMARARARLSVLVTPQTPFRVNAASLPPPGESRAAPAPTPPPPSLGKRRKRVT